MVRHHPRMSMGRSNPVALRGLLVATLVGLAATATVFAVWPELDLTLARLFLRPGGGFVGDVEAGRMMRRIFETAPFLVLAGLVVCYALRRLGGVQIWAPNAAGLLVAVASLALGPGLLVNTLLKDHWHRPRPVQVSDFGGPDAFRPFYRLDGTCQRNCSFVSGEGSTAAWTVGVALLAPPPARAVAVAAALIFAAAASLLRMAFGGHFASDSLFAALFTWMVFLGCWRTVAALGGQRPGSFRD